MKKLLSHILAGSMLLSIASTSLAMEGSQSIKEVPISQETFSVKDYGSMSYQHVIPAQYEDGNPFYEGFAAVKKNGKWGYIDKTGTVIVDFIYDDAGNFSEGFAIVGTREVSEYGDIISNLGIIDTNGNYTATSCTKSAGINFQPEDNFIGEDIVFHNGFVAVNDTMGHGHGGALLNKNGNYVSLPNMEYGVRYVSPVNEGYVVACDWEYKVLFEITAQGNCNEVYRLYGDVTDIVGMNQGYLLARNYIDDETTGYYTSGYGFYNLSSQQWHIDPQYHWVSILDIYGTNEVFGDLGLAMVMKDDVMGAVNKTGETVIPFIYEGLMRDTYGMIPYKTNGLWGYLDSNGDVAIPAQYDMVSFFGDNGLSVVLQQGVASIVDTKGSYVTGSEIVDVSAYFQYESWSDTYYVTMIEDMVIVRENGLVGYGKIDYSPNLPTEADMSGWAVDLVVESIEADLVPVSLQTLYTKNISRSDFAHLAVESLAVIMGTDVNSLVLGRTGKELTAHISDYPFVDCSDASVVAASALGIVFGKGDGIFDPYTEITRQEAAIMLKNMVSVAGGDMSNAPDTSVFDADDIQSWAKEAVNYVNSVNIMGTVGENLFSPYSGYTREQSFITVLNVLKSMK